MFAKGPSARVACLHYFRFQARALRASGRANKYEFGRHVPCGFSARFANLIPLGPRSGIWAARSAPAGGPRHANSKNEPASQNKVPSSGAEGAPLHHLLIVSADQKTRGGGGGGGGDDDDVHGMNMNLSGRRK